MFLYYIFLRKSKKVFVAMGGAEYEQEEHTENPFSFKVVIALQQNQTSLIRCLTQNVSNSI